MDLAPRSISTAIRCKAVTFSEFSELVLVSNDEEMTKFWYTSQDYQVFIQALREDAMQLAREDGHGASENHNQ